MITVIRKLIILVLALIALPVAVHAGMGAGKLLKPGSPAPDFKFKSIGTGEQSTLGNMKGNPVLLVFIQTACGSCQREMGFLKEMNASGTAIDVLVIFIDVKEMDFKGYIKQHGLPFKFAWDGDSSISEEYGVSFAPASFLIDKEGNIAKVYRGWSRAGEEVADDAKALLGK